MKRWRVSYGPDGEVLSVGLALQHYVGDPSSPISKDRADRFFCNAIDELGALARFLRAWKEQANG